MGVAAGVDARGEAEVGIGRRREKERKKRKKRGVGEARGGSVFYSLLVRHGRLSGPWASGG